MHYLDQSTFFAVLKDAWNRCEALDGMGLEQLEAALTPKNMPCAASSVEVERPPSIREEDSGTPTGSRDHELAWPEQ